MMTLACVLGSIISILTSGLTVSLWKKYKGNPPVKVDVELAEIGVGPSDADIEVSMTSGEYVSGTFEESLGSLYKEPYTFGKTCPTGIPIPEGKIYLEDDQEEVLLPDLDKWQALPRKSFKDPVGCSSAKTTPRSEGTSSSKERSFFSKLNLFSPKKKMSDAATNTPHCCEELLSFILCSGFWVDGPTGRRYVGTDIPGMQIARESFEFCKLLTKETFATVGNVIGNDKWSDFYEFCKAYLSGMDDAYIPLATCLLTIFPVCHSPKTLIQIEAEVIISAIILGLQHASEFKEYFLLKYGRSLMERLNINEYLVATSAEKARSITRNAGFHGMYPDISAHRTGSTSFDQDRNRFDVRSLLENVINKAKLREDNLVDMSPQTDDYGSMTSANSKAGGSNSLPPMEHNSSQTKLSGTPVAASRAADYNQPEKPRSATT